MTENTTQRFESDASNVSQRPTSESVETVHRANGWRLTVRNDGSIETHEMGGTRSSPFTTRDEWFGMESENYRCGKTIKGVLARYTHETRFDRGPDEHGAALRNGIISALQSVAADVVYSRECDNRASHVRHVNTPTSPKTAIVCGEHATGGRYVTLHPLGDGREQEGDDRHGDDGGEQ